MVRSTTAERTELTGDARRRAGRIGALTETTSQFEFSHVWLLLVGAVAAE